MKNMRVEISRSQAKILLFTLNKIQVTGGAYISKKELMQKTGISKSLLTYYIKSSYLLENKINIKDKKCQKQTK